MEGAIFVPRLQYCLELLPTWLQNFAGMDIGIDCKQFLNTVGNQYGMEIEYISVGTSEAATMAAVSFASCDYLYHNCRV